ncbi:MAG: thiamine phosphate synthase [Moraxella sp.]|nr:thiamine phosphate synthase [Moraxella sp.]
MQTPKLYLLTSQEPLSTLLDKLDVALGSGIVSLLQIRRKGLSGDALYEQSVAIKELAAHHKVPVLMNDSIGVAASLGVGVHLGQGDGSIRQARSELGQQALIGRTCHDDVELVAQAVAEGADYVAMGAMFYSATKQEARPAVFDDVKRQNLSKALQSTPLCVIGGIAAENANQLKQHLMGISIRYIALSGDVLAKELGQIEERCQAWRQVLATW